MSTEDELDESRYGLWLGQVSRAIGGKPGQKALRELEAALLALPKKRLIEGAICKEGDVCTVGALMLHRWVNAGSTRGDALAALAELWGDDDPFDALDVAGDLHITPTLAWELVWLNDEGFGGDGPPEWRYERVLRWVREQIGEAVQR